MLGDSQREAVLEVLGGPWDMVIVGGGITGAAIFHAATRMGARVLLVEQRDFAWGTSSRSSKLVHGGFRYLNQGQLRLVYHSVRQRRALLAAAPGLITPLGFMLAKYQDDAPTWLYQLGLALYDAMAMQWDHQRYDRQQFGLLAPHVQQTGLDAALRCTEATTDDARLVFRLIREGILRGGTALNYVHATTLLREAQVVIGVRLHDAVTGRHSDLQARLVINATGAWADQLRHQIDAPPRMRPLRGSHLVFPGWRFPVAQTIAFRHPLDRRFVSVVPWEGVTLVGTTDLVHNQALDDEPSITPDEVAYLMAGVEHIFPALGLTLQDIVATYSGVRPVVHTGKSDPSQESRDHLLLEEHGLLTITGGKLTTFRVVADEALELARRQIPDLLAPNAALPAFDNAPTDLNLPLAQEQRRRLIGRYGKDALAFVAEARDEELRPIPGTAILWAELRWAARHEQIIHLDDLLLRRVRLGLIAPQGGAAQLHAIRSICQDELGWDTSRWEAEVDRYLDLWRTYYGLPDEAAIPDWQTLLAEAQASRAAVLRKKRQAKRRQGVIVGAAAMLGLSGLLRREQRRRTSR